MAQLEILSLYNLIMNKFLSTENMYKNTYVQKC